MMPTVLVLSADCADCRRLFFRVDCLVQGRPVCLPLLSAFYPQIAPIIADYGVLSRIAAQRRCRATPPVFSRNREEGKRSLIDTGRAGGHVLLLCLYKALPHGAPPPQPEGWG
jgi:hypothetical protein